MISIEEDNDPQDTQEKPLKEWRAEFEAGSLSPNDFIKFFKKEAPKFFELETVAEAVRCSYNEVGAKHAIIDVFMEFILGDDPETVLDKLKLEGNTQAVCGKVFKNGEPTYSCRECGMDATCVLCVNCFKQSAHRYHKYKMSSSSGGGCCDCGDEEAWKKDQYCEEHNKGKQMTSESTIITSRMEERCEIAFRAILMYSVKFLELESQASLECLDGDYMTDEVFCTVLYNDESHTFDQVIQTLEKIVKCPQKDAMEITTSIDREGRAVVKCDSFTACAALREAVEKQPMQYTSNVQKLQPLKVSILHKRAVSCQQFALQLLTWFQELLTRHRTFRRIFAEVACDQHNRTYNIAHILENDHKLWKTARSCWHHLLISGMLMEYDNKKILAVEFSRHYATIMQDFIRDDHDHSFSIVSLSVQLFTVPTIAHHLISNEGILHKLLHTFYWESIEKYVQNRTLHFAKSAANLNIFKRAAYILYDLKYILSFKPDVWTAELREGFLEGCKVLLKLLNVMQGMESVQRQTGQHMDYEPEWESAFNLHIKLAYVITLVLEWCASDRDVLVKVYQMVMKHMMDNGFIIAHTNVESQKVAGHVARCIMYDVSLRPVSIHLPLSRFFAGIYLHLGKFGLNFDNATTVLKRTPEEIMEPILCTQTMIAQVHAGMWRRNGYSLLHQLYFYRNVRCRSEMLDRDIAGLQIGAALIESNQYLIHILNKFNLIEWVQPEYEPNSKSATDDDFIRQLSMIDEFLELLIVIIGERYVPGIANVTEEDRTKKEIIQQLCIKNFSHSELSRSLPESNNETVLEDVIDSIAIFKKPSKSNAKGVYELKEEFYEDYNMYFYHYTKEEKSKSEETQRLRRKGKNQLVCCPPPKLPKLADGFVSIANLLQCDVMISIMHTVLSRALDLKAKSFTENHLQKILHLIGYGLLEEESGNYPFLSFYECASKVDMLQLLEKLSHSARVEAHRDFIIWTIKKFKELTPNEKDAESMEGEVANQPMTAAESEKQEKSERAKLAAERRAKILAQMANAQKNFMQSNAELFASTSTASNVMDWETQSEDTIEAEEEGAAAYKSIACLGFDRRLQQPEEQKFKCILCFEDCNVSRDDDCLVYSAFIQNSKILNRSKVGADDDKPPSTYTGTCGHVMHAQCWKNYFDNEILKENRRPNRNRPPNNFIAEKKEFLCPYCRCLSNAVIPLTAPLLQYSTPVVIHTGEPVLSFETWLVVMHSYLNELYCIEASNDYTENSDDYNYDYKSKFPDMEKILRDCKVEEKDFKRICQSIAKDDVSSEWILYADMFMNAMKKVAPYRHAAEDCELLLVTWNSCAYTIQSIEMYLRAIGEPFGNELPIRHASALNGLIRVCCMLGATMTKDVASQMVIHLRGILETVLKQKGPSLLEWDCFSMLASLAFTLPAVMYSYEEAQIVPSGNFLEYYLLQLMFLANMVKAIALYKVDEEQDMEMDPVEEKDETKETSKILLDFYARFNLQARSKPELAGSVDAKRLVEHIKNESSQFLRCSCLLFRYMTDVEFPAEFNDTFADMCEYLGLNQKVEDYFNPTGGYIATLEHFGTHTDTWHEDPATKAVTFGPPLEVVPCVTPVRKLISLPDDYSDLINSVSEFSCPNNEREEMKTPTMCLVCGKVLCGQSYCCQPELFHMNMGACTYHAHYCGADIGMFLRIRDCQILYLGVNKGCFVQAPYLDEYGETDQGLRRGNPLRLCMERYRKLNLTWLGHGLHEEIARLTEGSNSVTATQWQHM